MQREDEGHCEDWEGEVTLQSAVRMGSNAFRKLVRL